MRTALIADRMLRSVLGAGVRHRARHGFTSRRDGSPPDESKQAAHTHDRQYEHSGLANDGPAGCRSTFVMVGGRRARLRMIGGSGHQPRCGDRRATFLGLAHDRRGHFVLGADGEGCEEHEQPTCQRSLGPGHSPSMGPHSRLREGRTHLGGVPWHSGATQRSPRPRPDGSAATAASTRRRPSTCWRIGTPAPAATRGPLVVHVGDVVRRDRGDVPRRHLPGDLPPRRWSGAPARAEGTDSREGR